MKINNNDNKIVLKRQSDDMRAFYDFYIDFIGEKDCIEMYLDEAIDITNWCEEPELVGLAIIDAKNRRRMLKP